jgi:hypothetical protein
MSASIREPDHGPSKDEPLKYAPKKTRQAEAAPAGGAPPGLAPSGAVPEGAVRGPESAAPERIVAGRAATQAADPPWRRSRPRIGTTAFAGDVAIAELRTKLALAPDRLPEPPPPSSSGSKLVWAGRITGIAVVVAVGVMGYRWGSSPGSRLHPSSPARQATTDRSATAATGLDSVVINDAMPTVYQPAAKPPAKPGLPGRMIFRQLTVGTMPVLQTDETARLTIAASDAGLNAAVVIGGLVTGSSLPIGREVAPNTWRIAVEDLPGAAIIPPRGFIGTMDLTMELRLADNSVADRKGLPVEWAGRGAAFRLQPRQHDAAEIAQIVKKGDELMANGDVSSARLMYQRAAEAGDAAAAFTLAETYDPQMLAKKGIPPDVGLAQQWYAKARDLGSMQASERLEKLARGPE